MISTDDAVGGMYTEVAETSDPPDADDATEDVEEHTDADAFGFLPRLLLLSDAASSSYFLFMVEFQWFFIALSVLPGISFAILAH